MQLWHIQKGSTRSLQHASLACRNGEITDPGSDGQPLAQEHTVQAAVLSPRECPETSFIRDRFSLKNTFMRWQNYSSIVYYINVCKWTKVSFQSINLSVEGWVLSRTKSGPARWWRCFPSTWRLEFDFGTHMGEVEYQLPQGTPPP